jgi:hypothetical protein
MQYIVAPFSASSAEKAQQGKTHQRQARRQARRRKDKVQHDRRQRKEKTHPGPEYLGSFVDRLFRQIENPSHLARQPTKRASFDRREGADEIVNGDHSDE